VLVVVLPLLSMFEIVDDDDVVVVAPSVDDIIPLLVGVRDGDVGVAPTTLVVVVAGGNVLTIVVVVVSISSGQ
jgi:hypothetical protein